MLKYYYLNPWNEMDRLFKEMNHLYRQFQTGTPYAKENSEFPPINMWSNEEKITIKAEVPGIDPECISIKAMDDTISISGERKELDAEKEALTYHRKERPIGGFKRMFKLPYKIDADQVEAKYEKGVLRIVLPRSEQDKPKSIKVLVS